jgi:hypothetical protein
MEEGRAAKGRKGSKQGWSSSTATTTAKRQRRREEGMRETSSSLQVGHDRGIYEGTRTNAV